MADPSIWATAIPIDTQFKDWKGSPPHLFGKWVGRPLQPWGFADIFEETGLVIVRDDIFEGTVGVPYPFKTHKAGQCISRFVTNSSYGAAVDHGVAYNVVMNPLMKDIIIGDHPDFITGERIYYQSWRLRGLQRSRATGEIVAHLFHGSSVGPDGIGLTGMYAVGNPPTWVLAADFTVGASNGDISWQVEVGFGSGLVGVTEVAATPYWPAFEGSIPTTDV